MPLLHDEDYETLAERSLEYEEDETNRFLVLKNYPLPNELYDVKSCDVLIVIPQNYNSCGNDMLWTSPALSRLDKKPIPRANKPGDGDNRMHNGKEFCRWSRHWSGAASWRPNIDNMLTILQRIEWALNKPDANK
ncbi:hypothetical protein MNBD_GAMMA12-1358 [hydrothermal vent metagenome]|uniref:Uncharacterized protein n=1 Tax=hydrothermal vent metagenome TaxID=652676 RepID=A0A3B0Y4Y8_9ZZZZ